MTLLYLTSVFVIGLCAAVCFFSSLLVNALIIFVLGPCLWNELEVVAWQYNEFFQGKLINDQARLWVIVFSLVCDDKSTVVSYS